MNFAKSLQVLILTVPLLIPSPSLLGQEKLTVAMVQSPTGAPFWVALESGFYKLYGLEIVPVQFTGGTQPAMALMSGDIQVSVTSGPGTINAMLKGGDAMIIGTTVGVFPYGFYVTPRIRRPEDLKGKRIGIGGVGGTLHHATRYALQKLGLNAETDVTLASIALPFSNYLAAMASGSIDATLFQFPETVKAKELGFRPIVDLSQSGIKFPTNQLGAARSYLKTNREKVKKFMMGYIAGLARFRGDRDFTQRVLRKYLNTSNPELLAGTYDFWVHIYPPKPYVDPEEMENYLATVKDRGSARAEQLFDNSLTAELDREGFIDAVFKKYGK
jgi:ABC-type nitrate/sulfonate/bicarbonate transport system substrate-binding protein